MPVSYCFWPASYSWTPKRCGDVGMEIGKKENRTGSPRCDHGVALTRLLDHLNPRHTPEGHELLEALSAAINDRAAMERLEGLVVWRAIG